MWNSVASARRISPDSDAVAHGKAGLALQRFELLLDLGDDVVDALEVLLGGAEPQFGLVAARMKAGNAGSLFEQRPALLRLGGDQLADLALADEGRRMRAGRGIGEQQLHVAGADFLAVDAIDRAFLALDAAGDFEHVGGVERRRRGAVGIVEDERDFGAVAAGPAARAREDHVVHARGAHRLVRAFAHHPAQRFDEVGLAAAIGADDAAQAGLEIELGRIGEGLEAGAA